MHQLLPQVLHNIEGLRHIVQQLETLGAVEMSKGAFLGPPLRELDQESLHLAEFGGVVDILVLQEALEGGVDQGVFHFAIIRCVSVLNYNSRWEHAAPPPTRLTPPSRSASTISSSVYVWAREGSAGSGEPPSRRMGGSTQSRRWTKGIFS